MTDDLSHDTHLRAALRHAPDHALSPPAGVSQTILNAARQAHRRQRTAVPPGPVVRITSARPRALEWLRQWLASPRLAGGLATGLVAALGLGLWLDLGQQPVIERAPVESRIEAVDKRGNEPLAAQPATAPAQAPPVAAAEPDPARSPRAARTADAGARERRIERAAREAPAPPPTYGRGDDSAAREAAPLAKTPPVAAEPPAPQPAPMADAAAQPEPAAPAPAADPGPLAQQRDASARSAQRMLSAAGGAAKAAAIPEGARAAAEALPSPALALLRRARSELGAGQARWTWTPPGSPLMAPFDDAGQAWLARVGLATSGRWTDAAEASGGDAIEVRWWRNEWPHATLRIEADGVRWAEHGGRARFAPLDAATLARLRSL